MRYLKTNTAVIVTVGPFIDVAGLVIETGLTITNERITLTADTDAGSAPTLILDNVTGATSGTANDLNYITNCDAGLMQLELAAADVNRVGRMFLTITDAANHIPVFHEFTVLPAQVYDSLILGTDLLDANASQLGGTTQTGRDVGTSVLLSSGTGTGQVNLSSGAVLLQATQTGVTIPTVTTVGTATAVTTVNGLAANVITAAAIANGAIDAATFAAGAIDAAAIADGAIDAATFATGAITAAAIAADAIGASELAADAVTEVVAGVWGAARASYTGAGTFGQGVASVQGNVTGNLGGNVTGNIEGDVDVTSFHAGSITSAAFASGAITAGVIATDAIGAAELAADAASEIGTAVWATATRVLTANTNLNDPTAAVIADAVWDEVVNTGHATANSAAVDLVAILEDTGTTLDGRIPAALVSGRVDASVGAMAANVITAAAIATDADAELADAVLDEVFEGTTTLRQALRLVYSVLGGKSAGGGTTTVTFRDIADSKNRVSATVDANGNRTAITLDVT